VEAVRADMHAAGSAGHGRCRAQPCSLLMPNALLGPSVWVCPPCTGDLPVFEERHVSYPQHRWRIGRERVTGAEVF